MAEVLKLTRKAYQKLEDELNELITVKRKENSERIKEAISYGDISENSEFDAAKNEQAEIEEKIFMLENQLRIAEVIEEDDITTEVVNVGVNVRVKELGSGDVEEFSIVSSTEIDPFTNLISNESPIGKSLMGLRVGDTAEVIIPDGSGIKFEVLEIFKK